MNVRRIRRCHIAHIKEQITSGEADWFVALGELYAEVGHEGLDVVTAATAQVKLGRKVQVGELYRVDVHLLHPIANIVHAH